MDDESFIGAFGDVPTDLAGDYSQLYIFHAEDFGAWCRRVRNAHEREVDGGVAGMTDAQLADHGLVELPKDAHGEYIHVGDTVYGCRSGMKMTISELRMTANGWSISTSRGYLTDAEVTHTRPDSWERIADDIETVVPINDEDDERLRHELADRIRRLADKEG